MTQKYNGWTNRETWLVNLYYSEYLTDLTNEYIENDNELDIYDVSNCLRESFEEMLEPDLEMITNSFITDLLDLGSINWYELAESYINDCK